MRACVLLLPVLLGACSKEPSAPAQPPPEPRLAATINLPGNDGLVHVLKIPKDSFGESTCLLYRGPNDKTMLICDGRDWGRADAE